MLQWIADFITYKIFMFSAGSRAAETINFFLYDSIKILLLLFVMISIMGFIRSYIPQHKVKEWIGGRHELLGYFFASSFGAITPFCSCSSVPIFLSFIRAGVPLGATFAFLVTSPLINEYLVVLMFGFFGFKITAIYVVIGMLIGIISGFFIQRLKLEKNIEKDFKYDKNGIIEECEFPGFGSRIKYGFNEGVNIVKGIWKWVLIGVAVGALIHNYIPQEFIQNVINAGGIFTVPIATILGVPMYGGCAAIVPVAVVLFNKGVPLGTALAFMMAVSALSLPEAIILRRAMNLKLIGIFFGIVALGIMFSGYLLNWLAPIIAMP